MIGEGLDKQLFNKIPTTPKLRVSIFGASSVGAAILNDLSKKRPDIKISCFIDNNKAGEYCGLPILKLKEFIKGANENDFVIIASLSAQKDKNTSSITSLLNIFDIYDIPFIPITKFVFDYYNGNITQLNDTDYNKIKNIFKYDEDKELFELLFKTRVGCLPESTYSEYFYNKYPEIYPSFMTIKHQYMDKIVKEKVKTIFDLGFNSGLNVIAYQRLLPNYQKTYGFDAIYDYVKNASVSQFIDESKVEIVKMAVGDRNGKTNFYVYTKDPAGSYADLNSNAPEPSKDQIKLEVDLIKLDDYCEKYHVYPDFIKMDIEGAELPALMGGINVIQKVRPQLAISIYHLESDFVNIPLYLAENLKNYTFKLGHYSPCYWETTLYAIPNELL